MSDVKIELPFKEWDLMPIEVYEKALTEVKEHFNDLSSEVESTTNKSIKTLITFATFIAISGLYILTKERLYLVSILILLASFYNMFGLYSIIKARQHYLKGLNIENMFNDRFDGADLNSYDKTALFYCNCLERYALKIGKLKSIVNDRNYEYNIHLGLTLFLVMGICFYIGCIS